ncbi:hypothetical protein [Cellvibrio japonicus]|uniref:PA5285-like protein n=1 Tax=Cellvibrio japonicus (strain Ueda107) TaxID=498211 RepID=B3PF75_CELJU|nr:hypothetical protein [Cellvibrio japonicus]ACE85916.1 PA5285-like protein [Cellvibrio japonicus Ueda107]
MTDEDPINDEELEDTGAEGDVDADEDDDESLDSDEASYAGSGGGSKAAEPDVIEDFSIASRQKVRDELESQIAEFLARGGKISEVPANVTADPPKKPTSDYGGRPI